MPGTEQLTVRAIAISWWGLTRLIRSLLSWIVSDDNASARVSHIAESWQHSKQGGGCCHATGGSAAISCPFFGCDSRFVASRGQPLLPWVCTVLCKNVEFGSKERLESLRVMLIRCPHVAGANGCGCRMRHYCCILLEPICHMYPYLYTHIYPYLSIYTYLCIYLSIHLFIYLPIYLPTYLWNILRTLNADLWFGLSCWGAFFWILSFFCSKSLASDDCCIGGFSLAGPNRSVRTSPLASSLSLVYCYTSDCFSVYIYILLLLLSLLISNFYLLNGYIYICINCNILSLIYIVIDSIPERSSVLTVGQPFRCSDSVTIEAAMEWECIYCNGWIWEYRIWNIMHIMAYTNTLP